MRGVAAKYAKTAGDGSGLVYDTFVKEAVESGRTLENSRSTYLTAETAERINSVAKALGLRAQFVDSVEGGIANAQIQGDTVLIEKNNPNPVTFLMGHEITHRIQELAPEQYRSFRKFISENDADFQAQVEATQSLYENHGMEISYEQAMDEAAADYAGRLMEDGALLDEFIQKNRKDKTLLEKVRDAIRSIIDVLTGREKQQAQTAEGKLTAALEAAAKQAESLQTQSADGTMSEPRESAKAIRGRSIELETMENNRFQRISQFHDNLPTEWYAFTGDYFYIYSNQSFTDYTILAREKINSKNRAAIFEFMEALDNGAINGAETFNQWASAFQRGKRSDSWHSIYAENAGTTGRYDGMDVSERGRIYGNDSARSGEIDQTVKPSFKTDSKFSLKSPVEETKDLVALHNLTEDKLLKSIALGGFPMPSIAVTRQDIPHTNFGDITLVMDKGTIDPKASRRNTVYSADAWTPTVPRVEYEADPKAERRITAKLDQLGEKLDKHFRDSLHHVSYGMDELLNRYDGEAGVIEHAMENYGMKAAFLEEQGQHIDPITKQVEEDPGYSESRVEKYENVAKVLGGMKKIEANGWTRSPREFTLPRMLLILK